MSPPRVVLQVPGRGLAVEPLEHVALGAARPLGDLGRGQRPGAVEGLVKAEPVAQADHHAAVAGGQVTEDLIEERFELRLIDFDRGGHGAPSGRGFTCWGGGAKATPRRRPRLRPAGPISDARLRWLIRATRARGVKGGFRGWRVPPRRPATARPSSSGCWRRGGGPCARRAPASRRSAGCCAPARRAPGPRARAPRARRWDHRAPLASATHRARAAARRRDGPQARRRPRRARPRRCAPP